MGLFGRQIRQYHQSNRHRDIMGLPSLAELNRQALMRPRTPMGESPRTRDRLDAQADTLAGYQDYQSPQSMREEGYTADDRSAILGRLGAMGGGRKLQWEGRGRKSQKSQAQRIAQQKITRDQMNRALQSTQTNAQRLIQSRGTRATRGYL